jgi:hypothetical protein
VGDTTVALGLTVGELVWLDLAVGVILGMTVGDTLVRPGMAVATTRVAVGKSVCVGCTTVVRVGLAVIVGGRLSASFLPNTFKTI